MEKSYKKGGVRNRLYSFYFEKAVLVVIKTYKEAIDADSNKDI